MIDPVKMIGVVRGEPDRVEDTLRRLVEQWRPNTRLAGVIAESHGLPDRFCRAGFLRNIKTGERFSIFRDLGPGSTTCQLEGGGALTAAEAVQRDIAAGCDLVVLSKFGRLEGAGKGLAAAFRATLDARMPLLTSMSPAMEAAWAKRFGAAFTVLPAESVEVDAWWRAARATAAVCTG